MEVVLSPHRTAALLLGLCCAPAAHAEDLFDAPGLVEILPPARVVADGFTPVTVYTLALQPDGSPLTGLELVPGTRSGEVGEWIEDGEGQYSFRFVPKRQPEARVVDLFLKGRTEDKQRVAPIAQVQLVPPLSTAMSVHSSPDEMVLGRDGEASLRIAVDPRTGPRRPEDLLVEASAGTVSDLVYMGEGEFRARFTAPASATRQLAVIGVADRRQPTRSYGAVAIPLVVEQDLGVRATAGASVLLRVGDREFGPVEVGHSGRAVVPVVLPPGPEQATQITVVDGRIEESEVELGASTSPRVHFLPTHPALPGDPTVQVPMRLMVFDHRGGPDADAAVELVASTGAVTPLVHEGDGMYAAEFTPPTMSGPGRVRFEASLSGEPGALREVDLVARRPANLQVGVEPSILPVGSDRIAVQAKVLDADGADLPGVEPVLEVVGAEAKGGGGAWTLDAGPGSVELLATAPAASTGNPVRGVVVLPVRSWVPDDGISTNLLTVVSVDEYGYPTAGVEVALQVEGGGGSVPESVVTGADGLGQVFYTAGREPGVVAIRAAAGDTEGLATFVQGPRDLAGIELPRSGSEADEALIRSWEGVVRRVVVERAR